MGKATAINPVRLELLEAQADKALNIMMHPEIVLRKSFLPPPKRRGALARAVGMSKACPVIQAGQHRKRAGT